MISYSYNIFMQYRNKPISSKKLKEIEGEISNECRRYLIGKILLKYKEKRRENEVLEHILTKKGRIFGISAPSAREYIKFSNVIDRLQEYLPEVVEDIINSKTRLSMKTVIMLEDFNFIEIRTIIERIASEKKPVTEIIKEQKALRDKSDKRGRPKGYNPAVTGISVKDTPKYNPDAPINALIYTVPSWINMIERTSSLVKFNEVSPVAKHSLAEILMKLTTTAEKINSLIAEE